MLKNQQELLLSYYHIPFITIPRLRCWVRLFCQESIPFTYFKAKFPQWMIYFSFKNGHLQKKYFVLSTFISLLILPTLTCAKKSNNIWFVYSEKVTQMFSLNNINILCNLTCLFQLQRLTRTEDFEFFTRISLYTIAGIEEHLL